MKLFLFENQIVSIFLIIFVLAIWLFSIQCAWSLGRRFGNEECLNRIRSRRKSRRVKKSQTVDNGTESETVRVVGTHEPKHNSEVTLDAK